MRQGEFVVWHGRKKCLRHVFLFEEMIVFSKTKRSSTGHDVYIYKNSIKVLVHFTSVLGRSTSTRTASRYLSILLVC